MRFSDAIAMYLHDMKSEGRINSARSERTYYDLLALHAEDVGNRDPRATGRDDVKRTLRRWSNPNTQATRRATLVSFYDWTMEEGYRKDNPARQTRRPKKRPTTVYRLNVDEAAAMLTVAEPGLERRAITFGLCAGLRSAEMLGLKPLHLQRPGYIWVSADIAKGGRERYVPVLPELEPVVEEVLAGVAPTHFVLCGQHVGLNGRPPNHVMVRRLFPERPMGANTLYKLVGRVGKRAGIAADVHPHLLRHAFCDHVTRGADLTVAQALMGHADIATTRGYAGAPTLEELSAAIAGVAYTQQKSYPPKEVAILPAVETVGIEPTLPADGGASTGGSGTETP